MLRSLLLAAALLTTIQAANAQAQPATWTQVGMTSYGPVAVRRFTGQTPDIVDAVNNTARKQGLSGPAWIAMTIARMCMAPTRQMRPPSLVKFRQSILRLALLARIKNS
jgi:hypothetical protein